MTDYNKKSAEICGATKPDTDVPHFCIGLEHYDYDWDIEHDARCQAIFWSWYLISNYDTVFSKATYPDKDGTWNCDIDGYNEIGAYVTLIHKVGASYLQADYACIKAICGAEGK